MTDNKRFEDLFRRDLSAMRSFESSRRREMFAAAALTGLLASWPPNATLKLSETAVRAVEFADATIARLDATEAKP